jgi:hypothetical protein
MSDKLMASTYLFESQRRAKSSLQHQRSFSQWLLNAAIKRTQSAIAQHIESKRTSKTVGQLEMFT